MRSLCAWSIGALLICASAVGCSHETAQPRAAARASRAAVARPPQPARGGNVIVEHREYNRGVTEAQPATPAAQPPVEPNETLGEERARVSQAVALATQQLNRLTRIEESADPDRRNELEDAVGDLRNRREKVLQDMRELELRGPAASATASDTLREELYRDLAALQAAVRESYAVAPPPGSGMSPPAPIPPGPMH
ncbi:MAG TPA: hypothetical protein VF765_10325 [Polyangiaceae bacterium]